MKLGYPRIVVLLLVSPVDAVRWNLHGTCRLLRPRNRFAIQLHPGPITRRNTNISANTKPATLKVEMLTFSDHGHWIPMDGEVFARKVTTL